MSHKVSANKIKLELAKAKLSNQNHADADHKYQTSTVIKALIKTMMDASPEFKLQFLLNLKDQNPSETMFKDMIDSLEGTDKIIYKLETEDIRK